MDGRTRWIIAAVAGLVAFALLFLSGNALLVLLAFQALAVGSSVYVWRVYQQVRRERKSWEKSIILTRVARLESNHTVPADAWIHPDDERVASRFGERSSV